MTKEEILHTCAIIRIYFIRMKVDKEVIERHASHAFHEKPASIHVAEALQLTLQVSFALGSTERLRTKYMMM